MKLHRKALLLVLCLAPVGFAQDLPDAGLPDASVGEGGADRDNEENDQGGPCRSASDCQGAFTCENGRCVPTQVVDASCGVAPGGLLLWLAALCFRRRGA